jgi:hypothetical protein
MSQGPREDPLESIRRWAERPHRGSPSAEALARARTRRSVRTNLLGIATLLIIVVLVAALGPFRAFDSRPKRSAAPSALREDRVGAAGRVVPLVLTSGTRLYLVVPGKTSSEDRKEVRP